jgi:hypothetical protein
LPCASSTSACVFSLLALLIYPWHERLNVDYDYNEHSIAENWGIDLSTAAGGFKGRITTRTHVVHLTQDVTVLGAFNRFAAPTGDRATR